MKQPMHAILMTCMCCMPGCASVGLMADASVSGTAVVRRAPPLPPEATFQATLERRSGPDEPPVLVSRIRLSPAGTPPFQFVFDDVAQVPEKNHTYAVRARVDLHGEILLVARPRIVVPGKQGTAPIRLVLHKPAPEAPLVESYWILTELNSQPVRVPERRHPAHLVSHPKRKRVIAFGSCNNMIGTVEARGQRLRFSPMPGKPVSCDPQLSIDEDLRRSFGRAVRWRIAGKSNLELLDSQGACMLRFARVERE